VAVQQISELMAVEGVDIVGPLPAGLQTTVVFSGAVFAGSAQPAEARALLRFLAGAATPEVLRAKGLQPA
jgi:molybdate transport system substrate-binding protein